MDWISWLPAEAKVFFVLLWTGMGLGFLTIIFGAIANIRAASAKIAQSKSEAEARRIEAEARREEARARLLDAQARQQDADRRERREERLANRPQPRRRNWEGENGDTIANSHARTFEPDPDTESFDPAVERIAQRMADATDGVPTGAF